MKRIFAVCLILVLTLLQVGCVGESAVLDESRTFDVSGEINSLKISVNAADFVIREAEEFSVESNLKFLSVVAGDGTLYIIDEARNNANYISPTLTVNIPAGTEFDDVSITTGAAKLTVDKLSAKNVRLNLGAGDVKIEDLNAKESADIQGGAGKISILNGALNNLNLKMGVGELNLTASLLGEADLTFGIGGSNLTLVGGKEDYSVELEKGIGSITVDGEEVTDFGSFGDGENYVTLKGGIGALNLYFRESSAEQ